MGDLLTISEISRRSGVASSALRFYEDRGLIESERIGTGHRRYPRAVLRRMAFIVFSQKICGRVAYPLMARIMHKIVVFHGQGGLENSGALPESGSALRE